MTMHLEKIRSYEVKEERKPTLELLSSYLKRKLGNAEPITLNFICTHNSRRSQFAQFWSSYFSEYFGLNIKSVSGGTEVTACHPNTIKALNRIGFAIKDDGSTKNPHYSISNGTKPFIELFSKLHTDSISKGVKFAALMCCSDAAENCPFVPGTEITIPLNYTDPKWADGTIEEESAYDFTCLQIAAEIYHVYSQLNK